MNPAVRLALAALVACAPPGATADSPEPRSAGLIAALTADWSGIHDNLEQITIDASSDSALLTEDTQRVRTLVVPLSLPWLGAHVLSLEEFLHDDPEHPRRLLLLTLEPATQARQSGAIRIRQYTFRSPQRWQHLYADPQRLQALSAEDLESEPGCDLTLAREREQFRGGTSGRTCHEAGREPQYVDYRMLVGPGLFWYRKRVRRLSNDELLLEVVGYDWFELHVARLYACRVRSADAPLALVELHDQGGRARFETPDGRKYELQLHSSDWPYDVNRDALLLVLWDMSSGLPVASSWTAFDSGQLSLQSGAIEVRCGPLAPDESVVG